ncbi:MAG TPA: 6-carboxytetrahydropterin synthase [Anaerolineales bacterium]|nr:6-carboxytetrahydropterin synthase [Anaerolineales bacterium]
MYSLAVKRSFIARHYLTGGDWGAENDEHAHHYVVELELAGAELDQHGYLVDIVDIERHLDETVARYRDRVLNDLPEFAGLNPSIEHFTRILAERLNEAIGAPNLSRLAVRIWENEIAWACFTRDR